MGEEGKNKEQLVKELDELRQRVAELEELETARQRAEKELQEQLHFLKQLLNTMPIPIFYKDRQGIYRGCNEAFEKFVGLSKEQVVGKTVYEVFSQDLAETYYQADTELFHQSGVQIYETSIRHADGTRHNIIFNKATYISADGQVAGLIGAFLDITERKRAEEALQKSEEQLRDLAAQLLTTQENERRKIALEVHDRLGSSLSAIKFKMMYVLQGIDQSPPMKISQHLEALITIIQDTIEEAKRIQTDLRPSILDDFGIIATFSWFCRRLETIYSGIRVEQEITIQEEEVPDYLKIALFRIAQEAMNNIGKHARADLVHLGLGKVNGTIELTIEDNGEGFDQERLSAMESSKKGLGLSSMKERTEILGGYFKIESAIGKGTVIKATWPA